MRIKIVTTKLKSLAAGKMGILPAKSETLWRTATEKYNVA